MEKKTKEGQCYIIWLLSIGLKVYFASFYYTTHHIRSKYCIKFMELLQRAQKPY